MWGDTGRCWGDMCGVKGGGRLVSGALHTDRSLLFWMWGSPAGRRLNKFLQKLPTEQFSSPLSPHSQGLPSLGIRKGSETTINFWDAQFCAVRVQLLGHCFMGRAVPECTHHHCIPYALAEALGLGLGAAHKTRSVQNNSCPHCASANHHQTIQDSVEQDVLSL